MEFRVKLIVVFLVFILAGLAAFGISKAVRGEAAGAGARPPLRDGSAATNHPSLDKGSLVSDIRSTVDDGGIFAPGGQKEQAYSIRAGLSVVARLFFAMVLGALVALHPTRILRGELTKKKLDTIKAQVLICIAGAMLVILIEGAVERAFGLLGLGSFIRFRTSVKDPRETAIMFLLIGLGMAAGLEMYWVGVFGAGFLFIILFPLEWTLGRSESLLKVIIETPNPKAAPQVVRPILEAEKLNVIKSKVNVKKNKAVFQVNKRKGFDLAALQETLLGLEGIGVEAVTFDEMAGEDLGFDE